jgi:uncharacterized membrane protein YeaQ/YmgE (transglycosylase-associated protein family)
MFIITLVFTLLCVTLDVYLPHQQGKGGFFVLSLLGMCGSIISFFTALCVAWRSDVPEEEEAEDGGKG